MVWAYPLFLIIVTIYMIIFIFCFLAGVFFQSPFKQINQRNKLLLKTAPVYRKHSSFSLNFLLLCLKVVAYRNFLKNLNPSLSLKNFIWGLTHGSVNSDQKTKYLKISWKALTYFAIIVLLPLFLTFFLSWKSLLFLLHVQALRRNNKLTNKFNWLS